MFSKFTILTVCICCISACSPGSGDIATPSGDTTKISVTGAVIEQNFSNTDISVGVTPPIPVSNQSPVSPE